MSAHEQFADDLALYALGSLEGGERAALEKHLQECASCRTELEQLRGDLSLLSLAAGAAKPPARSRQRLISAIAAEPRSSQTTFERPRRSWLGSLGWVAAAAMVLLSLGLLRQNSSLQRDFASLRAQFGSQQSELLQAKEMMRMLTDPDAQHITLVAGKAAPQPQGKAIYQRRSSHLLFMASNLPPLPSGKMYELWLIPMNGAPIPAGMFKPDARGSATVVNPPLPGNVEAKNFAVTLEPEEGAHDAPHGSMVIVGAGE
jgi:anti-sigma-K factor RskA